MSEWAAIVIVCWLISLAGVAMLTRAWCTRRLCLACEELGRRAFVPKPKRETQT